MGYDKIGEALCALVMFLAITAIVGAVAMLILAGEFLHWVVTHVVW